LTSYTPSVITYINYH